MRSFCCVVFKRKKCVKKPLVFPALLVVLSCLCSCGGSSNGIGIPPKTVMAQQTYSTSSISGTYSVTFFHDQATGSMGTIQFDGKGAISGEIVNKGYVDSCQQFSLKGNYSLQDTGLGSASLTLTPSSPSTVCAATTTALSIAAEQQGQSLTMLSGGQVPVFGRAIKQ